ncbi:DUF2723 domain-containing protein [Mucilaginibacter sp. JRF]|uniref:DUF2723 domain-containing protein n=1 Tax=Mucilaginibacter sp. JRF TaxID=2780088 RepID=UPI001882F240|nr:DUF2723 domain-containing protein [Mucilaginibacter sp. JRF]MBE9584689.1 DUF2723 domain-containing protein [Mucilaginibacter sp. JRF]
MNYNKINNLFGWLAFLIATITYVLTLEPSTSFWDCGEFIACIYRLQVAHQPGAPLFTMIGKAFSLLSLGDNTKVAYFTNMASALSSSATILFLFWTITALAKKLLVKPGVQITTANLILIIGAGLVGSLAYTFSDTFWFSAVESEVYAESSLCTAIVFWAILKWEAHADEPHANRWIVFIAYVMGLSIGIHLLNLLVIPAIALVIYFRKTEKATSGGALLWFFGGIVAVAFVLWGVIQFTVKGAAFSDLFFVNTLGMGFGTGAVTFFVLLVALLITGIYYTINPVKPAILAAAVLFVLLAGISSGIIGLIVAIAVLAFLEYVVKIREKRFALNSFLVCLAFILFGYSSFVMIVIRAKAGTNLNNSDPQDAFALNSYLNRDQYGDTPLMYGQFFDSELTDQKEGAAIYRRGKEKYEIAGRKIKNIYDRNTFFPRMFSDKPSHAQFYRQWAQLGAEEHPNLVTNFKFFMTWQVTQMYTRYFLWNFVGRTNDQDGQIDANGVDGNWVTGFRPNQPLPYSVTKSKSYNHLYALPLIIGLMGAVYHFRRNQMDAGIVGVLFFFTGLAIVLYLNQDPLQPRERDYAYAGSFYAFAIWIGLGVLFIAEILSRLNAKTAAAISTVVCLLAAPALMASQEWDDHNRSTKLTPHDMAYNYLNSCEPNAILFVYGDNDTYPLWYIQEVEGVRPDVRIVNLSLLGTDWYIRQMKGKMNESAPLPITMPNEKFQAGVRDVIYYSDGNVPGSTDVKELFDFITSDDPRAMAELQSGAKTNYLPTKNFKLSVDVNEAKKSGAIPAGKEAQAETAIEWKYPGNYITKDNLALLDILAHNDWKRPIYFAVTVGSENMIGLDRYLYNEGFAYHLMPLKPDTTVAALEATNSDKMYDNMVNKFKYGNFKTAKYLDHESQTMFYPLISRMYMNLADNMIKEGKNEQVKKLIAKYDAEMPADIPVQEVAVRKYYLLESAYRVGETKIGNKLAAQIDDYLVDMLNYKYESMQNGDSSGSDRDIQFTMSLLNGLVGLTKDFHQTTLNKTYSDQLKNFSSKFGVPQQ